MAAGVPLGVVALVCGASTFGGRAFAYLGTDAAACVCWGDGSGRPWGAAGLASSAANRILRIVIS
jgi:hypothetical protein